MASSGHAHKHLLRCQHAPSDVAGSRAIAQELQVGGSGPADMDRPGLRTLDTMTGASPRRAAAVRALAQLPPPCTCSPPQVMCVSVRCRQGKDMVAAWSSHGRAHLQLVCTQLLVRLGEGCYRCQVIYPTAATSDHLDSCIGLSRAGGQFLSAEDLPRCVGSNTRSDLLPLHCGPQHVVCDL